MSSRSPTTTGVQRILSHFFSSILKKSYDLLYHQLAFTYDFVAWLVSNGRWTEWVYSAADHVSGSVILELGPGPGHLLRHFADKGYTSIGLELSPRMISRAKKRILPNSRSLLLRGTSYGIPIDESYVDSVVSTFPSDYIFERKVLREVHRVLKSNGKLIIIPYARTNSPSILNLSQSVIGGKLDGELNPLLSQFGSLLANEGFNSEFRIQESNHSIILIIIAEKI